MIPNFFRWISGFNHTAKSTGSSISFTETFDQFLAQANSISDKDNQKKLFDDHIAPILGAHDVLAITRSEVERVMMENSHDLSRAQKLHDLLSSVFRYAESTGLRPEAANPCVYVKRP